MKKAQKDWLLFLYCLLVAAVCLLLCSKSSPLYPINDWTDANAYLSCGKGMLNGRVMYRDLYEHKGPLLYALHALCCLIDSGSFLGVYFLETLAGGLFLLTCYRTLALYGAHKAALPALPILAALVYTSVSFQMGDSAEELCLPMLAWSLYSLLRWLRQSAPRRMDARSLTVNGLLCGCVLWVKFTMLGFYIPWVLGLMLWHLLRREWKHALSVLGWLALGIAVSTIPWLIYFGVNGAILPWLKTYLYDNIFLYQDAPSLGLIGRLKATVRSAWDWFSTNWAYTAPMTIGFVWITLRAGRKPSARTGRASGETPDALSAGGRDAPQSTVPISTAEKLFLWALMGVAALGVFIGGKSYVYYGLVLAAFAAVGALPFCLWLGRALMCKKALARVLCVLIALGTPALCVAASPNAKDMLKPRDQTMQYQFAAIVNRTPHATLLNYGFMDAGFYTACNIAPSVKYFHQTNVHLQDMLDEQARYIADGVTDYVVTRGKQPESITDRYELVATADAPADFWYRQVYLYRRKGL
ncbi:MAG TPA: hypothetical protein PKJ47_12620 [Candidatus Limiplasma sp.]|nr:hypothetical protein [Candidatus Limiplasma sp.]